MYNVQLGLVDLNQVKFSWCSVFYKTENNYIVSIL
jgi:hypothetical protein